MGKNFPLWLKIGIIVIAIYFIYTLISNSLNDQQPSKPQQSTQPPNITKTELQSAPDFTLKDLNGNSVSLSDFEGSKNVYVNFWATWCPPCQKEMPDLEKVYKAYKDKDLVVLAVNSGEVQSKVQEFMTSNGYTFPVLLDTNNKAAALYKASSIPTSVFINKEGLIIGKKVGLMNYSEMEVYITELYK